MIAVRMGNSGLCVLSRPAATVRQANETSPGLYGVTGLYRIGEVTDEDEATGDRPDAEELARRRHVITIMEAALVAGHTGAVGVCIPSCSGS